MNLRVSAAFWGIIVTWLLIPATHARGQSTDFRGWVALFEPESIARLENENRLTDLCAQAADLGECYNRMLAPALSVVALYPRPDTTASPIGDLVVAVVPGRGLSAFFRPVGAAEPVWFQPDVFLQDWGYGPPFFHQTILNEEGRWFQLPPDPWTDEVWILKQGDALDRVVLSVRPADIVELDGRGMFVVRATSDSLTMRPEQDADLWCREGDPPPIRPAPSTTYSRRELVDENGHLRIRPKYMKGC